MEKDYSNKKTRHVISHSKAIEFDFSGAKIHNTHFSDADVSFTTWGHVKPINSYKRKKIFLKPESMTEATTNPEVNRGQSSTELAFERTMLAHERTLMAWIRTAISMISFGFTIYKFFAELSKSPEGQNKLFTPRIVGMIMISFGLLSLLLGQIQHQVAVKRIRQQYPGNQRSVSSVISVLVLMFGLAMFLGALFRQ